MKKKSLYLIAFFVSIYHINAQDITFGLTGGVNYSDIGILYHKSANSGGGGNVTPVEDFDYDDNHGIGYHFGGYLKINIGYFYLKPEIVYTSLENGYDLAHETTEWTQENIDFGLLFGYRIFQPFTIYAGPTLSIINDRLLEGNQIPLPYENTNLGLSLGGTVEFGRFGIDIRYSYGLTKIETQKIDLVRSTYGTNVADLLEYNSGQFIISMNIDLFSFGGEKKSKRLKSDWRNHKNL